MCDSQQRGIRHRTAGVKQDRHRRLGEDRTVARCNNRWLPPQWVIGFCMALVLCGVKQVAGAEPTIRTVARTPAQPLSGGVQWLNTKTPITLQQLRGKIVILDFWTYCCINCLQILPDLKRLEQEYPNEIVVIGVHAPKFFGERDTQNIREAIMRHGIQHPVLNDANAIVAKRYGIQGWPALRFIDPEGYLFASHNGEATFGMLDALMRSAVGKFRREGTLDEAPIRFDLEQFSAEPSALRFPGKVLVDPEQRRLFVADSGHNRIVIASLDGKLLDTVGTGAIGHDDGDYDSASFASPQGMAIVNDVLYVADTENHMLRRIDLSAKNVQTIAGTGEQAEQIYFRASRQPKRVPLASPWDLWIHSDNLYIAMAGSHQIWRLSLNRNSLHPYAGNGIEDIVDGPALARAAFQRGGASFAQPSGFASDGQQLFIADSEGSTIRSIPFARNPSAKTLLGTAQRPASLRLFTYGDRDGPLGQALLQHPLGVAYAPSGLFVADTYNNKIKLIDLDAGNIRTVAGSGQPGSDDETPRFNEPAGLSYAEGKLYVADTNNHLIRVVDVDQEFRASTLEISGLSPPEQTPQLGPPLPTGVMQDLGRVEVASKNGQVELAFRVFLPRGAELNPDVPMSYIIRPTSDSELIDAERINQRVEIDPPTYEHQVQLPLAVARGSAQYEISLAYFYCEANAKSICKIGNANWTVELVVAPDARNDAVLLDYAAR